MSHPDHEDPHADTSAPAITPDDAGSDQGSSGWTIELEVGPRPGDDRVAASVLALSDGSASTIGDIGGGTDAMRMVLVAGAFGRGPNALVRPLPGPVWTDVDGGGGDDDGTPSGPWRLDLRRAVLSRTDSNGVRVSRFQSIARPGVGCARVEQPHDERARDARPNADRRPGDPVTTGSATRLRRPNVPTALAAEHRFVARLPSVEGVECAATVSDRAAVTVAVAERSPDPFTRDRFAAVLGGVSPQWGVAAATCADASEAGFDRLLEDHHRAWSDRWDGSDIEIVGDPDSQRAVRYALFHLLSCASTSGESAVGARGLTGLAYAGHVFWDTDVFVLPTLAATLPAAARSVLEYRLRRTAAARSLAVARGRPGLRFPWESADDGSDATPTSAVDVDGSIIPILTGLRAEHINSAVAWAVGHYVEWTADESVLDDGGRDLVIDTAEYLAARARVDADGVAHLDGVIGPDEYHDTVNDNAYTNGMARWHLRRAWELAGPDGAVARRCALIADALETGFDGARGRHEQFAGFSDLEDLLIGEVAAPPVAADVLLGRTRVAHAQIIKQPDVLMLHHLLPGECPVGSLAADIDYYLPRTAHGSSLSPAICAAQLARVGRTDEALALFDIAARLDLDDLTGTTTGGLHLATMGGLWQAVVWGFAGIRPVAGALRIEPRLPERWTTLRLAVTYRGVRVRVDVDHHTVSATSEHPVPVIIDGRSLTTPASVARSQPSPSDLEPARTGGPG